MANEIFQPIQFNPYSGSVTGVSAAGTTASNTGANFGALMASLLASSVGSGLGSTQASSASSMLGMGNSLMGGTNESGQAMQTMIYMLLMALANKEGGLSGGNLSQFLGGSSSGATPQAAPIGTDVTPDSGGTPTTPVMVSSTRNRSPALYRAVLDQFNVETDSRYAVNKRGTGDTYCNIFVWDATSAMGAEIPHWYDAKTGVPASVDNKQGANAMNANAMNRWLNTHGTTYGWQKVSAREAQMYANQGMPAVASWYNDDGHGHVSMIAPSPNGTYDQEKGAAIAQAGSKLINEGYITDVFKKSAVENLDYFVHL